LELKNTHVLDVPKTHGCTVDRPFGKEEHKLATALIYKASISEEQQLPSFAFVWRNFTPSRSGSLPGSYCRTGYSVK